VNSLEGESTLILNPAAGKGTPASQVQEILKLLEAEGIRARPMVLRKGIEDAARSALRKGSGLVIAAGGDGTVSSVASVLAGTDGAMGVLPAGTFNHFARDLGIPIDLAAAAKVIGRGKTMRVDVAEVNGRKFVNNSSVGLYPNMVLERVQQRKHGYGRWLAFAYASVRVLRRFPRIDIRIVCCGEEIKRSAPLLFVGNNAYEMTGWRIGRRERLDAGQLFCCIASAASRWELFKLLLRALTGRLRRQSDFDVFHSEDVNIDSSRRRLHIAVDGEVVKLPPPLRYRIHPRALNVIVP